MKLALAADAHFGMHGNSEAYSRSIETAFAAMRETMARNDVNAIAFLGDLFDTRFSINQAAEDSARKSLEALEKDFAEIFILPGNHDSYFANTVRINSVNKFSRIACIVDSPSVICGNVLAIPWICDENRAECLEAIGKAGTPWVVGHFDVRGARMNNSRRSEDGLSLSMFRKFRKAFSGHFHSRQTLGNVEYVGSLVQTSFADEGEPRGFAVLDTETGQAEFHELPSMKHVRIRMDESFRAEDHDIAGNAVELLVPERLWGSREARLAEKAVSESGAASFPGSKRDLEETENAVASLPAMKRDESVMDYVRKYVEGSGLSCKEEVLAELSRLHEAVT